jgi:hypothetical protein
LPSHTEQDQDDTTLKVELMQKEKQEIEQLKIEEESEVKALELQLAVRNFSMSKVSFTLFS